MEDKEFVLGELILLEIYPVEKILNGNPNAKDKYRYIKNGKYRCFCGNEFVTEISKVKFGNTKSCGCYKQHRIIAGNTKHGMAKTKLYNTHSNMIKRCNSSKDPGYKNYGGRGIKVCKSWHKFENFLAWALKNGYQEGLTIDRINNNKGYYPKNCRWVDYYVQATNRRFRPNKTGFPGISITGSNRYYADIFIDGKNKSLGTYDTPEKAFEIYLEAKFERDKHTIKKFNDGYSS